MYGDFLSKEAFEALRDYFNHLKKVGYLRYDTVYKLLTFLFIDKMLNGKYVFTLTEEDYKIMSEMLQCLYGTCLIPYSEYTKRLPFVGDQRNDGNLRKAETLELRHTENSEFRIIESRTKLIK